MTPIDIASTRVRAGCVSATATNYHETRGPPCLAASREHQWFSQRIGGSSGCTNETNPTCMLAPSHGKPTSDFSAERKEMPHPTHGRSTQRTISLRQSLGTCGRSASNSNAFRATNGIRTSVKKSNQFRSSATPCRETSQLTLRREIAIGDRESCSRHDTEIFGLTSGLGNESALSPGGAER